MPQPTRDQALLACVDATPPAWIVTPTRRLARTLSIRVAELRAAAGRGVAETPPILALDDWVQRLGTEALAREAAAGSAGRVLLSTHAARVLWERVIADAPGDLPRELLDRSALAATAMEAWQRVCLWGEPSWSGPLSQDAEYFRDWLPSFRARLADGAFVTAPELVGVVESAIAAGKLDDLLPRDVAAPGFEKPGPALARWTAALRGRGVTVRDGFGTAPPERATPRVWKAATPAAEVRAVAAAVRERLLAEPELRIAVLAPDASALGHRLERVFEEELDPTGVLDLEAASARRFDFSEAPSLADYPLVAGALDLLSIDGPTVPFETASRILLSEHPRRAAPRDDEASTDEAAAASRIIQLERQRALRGRVEASLRRDRSAVLRVAGTSGSLATQLRRGGLGGLAKGLEELAADLERDAGTRRSPSAWRRKWTERLRLVGWPGELDGDIEGLVFRRWRDALDEFAGLELVEPSMEARHALSRLRAVLAATPVQPPAQSRSVQVMSLLDAAGLDFDAVWVVGLTSTAFPPAPRPNPLLPVLWQRAQPGMPRASVEGERELASAVWDRVLRSAPEVHASWAVAGDSADEQSPSALVAAAAADAPLSPPAAPWWLESARLGPALVERPPETPVPALVRSGGSSILLRQAECPFRAFATTRLGAEKLDAIAPQPDPARRGTLVHAALAAAYGVISSSVDLAGLSDENIADVARSAARSAVESDGQAAFFADADDLAHAVRAWLAEMVAAWMRHERDVRRTPWEIASLEEKDERDIPASGDARLTIRFRPDRIDRLADGSLAILDFKTSSVPKGPELWKGERPKDPQLPLYLALLARDGQDVRAIAFANLSARDKCLLKGFAAEEHTDNLRPPGKKDERSAESWQAEVDGWRDVVESLALDFLAGDARVAPRDAKACAGCASHALCRVHELGAPDEDDESAEEGE